MKKICLAIALGVLSMTPVAEANAFATTTATVNDATANALADRFVATAKAAEAKAIVDGRKDQDLLNAVVVALEADVEAAVANGNSAADISAGLIRGGNRSDISKVVAAAFGVVRHMPIEARRHVPSAPR